MKPLDYLIQTVFALIIIVTSVLLLIGPLILLCWALSGIEVTITPL